MTGWTLESSDWIFFFTFSEKSVTIQFVILRTYIPTYAYLHVCGVPKSVIVVHIHTCMYLLLTIYIPYVPTDA